MQDILKRMHTFENMISNLLFFICLLSSPKSVLPGSHSLWMMRTYIKGETPFPEFSITFMVDDFIVGNYNTDTNTYVPRDNITNEEQIVLDIFDRARNDLYPFCVERLKFHNSTERLQVYQMMSYCDLWDNDKPGQMITKIAFNGSTTDEIRLHEDKFTHQGQREMTTISLEILKRRHETVGYPYCMRDLSIYIKNRRNQLNRIVKPKVRLFQKANSDSGGIRATCLATGFYPRHLNLSLFRDGQPVSDHEVSGGDLLPNGDGTYQMRKTLEIREEERHKHTYSCSTTHLSLDNKLDVTLEFDPGEPFQSYIPIVVPVLALVFASGTGAIIYICCKRKKRDYSSASTSEECHDTTQESNIK